MAKYRKKPVVIEAVRLGWDTWCEVCDFVTRESFVGGVYLDDETKEPLPPDKHSNTMGLYLMTLEGQMLARQGDWIIKGAKGEFYSCRDDVFKATYEEVP